MNYLSHDAAKIYFDASEAAFRLGAISHEQLLHRLAALAILCRPDEPVSQMAGRRLRESPAAIVDDWLEVRDSPEPTPSGDAPPAPQTRHNDDPILHFIPGPGTGLSVWVFHPYDPDYFPSIPHGHFNGQPQPKLDAYLGWVYQSARQIRREPRASIVALWNDAAFRAVAAAAINYYLTSHPQYSGWRVRNPRRLPRRRKP